MTSNPYIFTYEIAVRDYELDSEGIVNNANYLHYFEITRHAFCLKAGMSFNQMVERGITPVVSRIEVDYMHPLRSGDVMDSKLWIETQGVRFVFHQDIFNQRTGEVCAKAVVNIVSIENGKLSRNELLKDAFKQYLK